MRHVVCGALAGLIGILMAGEAAGAEAAVVVRTYTQADSAGDLRVARRTAGAILGAAGVEVTWLECALPDDPGDAAACGELLGANELVVRIVSSGTASSTPGTDTLGFALVDAETGGGSLATVYADRVALMARAAGADGAELLGRAIAHEIGHLLLGTNRHARRGLMRASWSAADLRRKLPNQWVFVGSEAEVIRKRAEGVASLRPALRCDLD